MSEKKLNAQQAFFVLEYLKDLNATQAAIRSGYCKKSPSNAGKVGPAMVNTPHIALAIQEQMDKRAARLEISADVILREILFIARADLAQAYTREGKLKSIHDIPEDTRRAMAGVKVYEEFDGSGRERYQCGETVEVKFWDKPKALELLGKHLKLFTEVHEHKMSLEDLVAGSNEEKKK